MELRTFAVIFLSTALAGIIRIVWARHSARKRKQPTAMRLRGGVYEPWGFEQRWSFWKARIGEIALIWFGLIFLMLLAGSIGLIDGY